MVVYKFSFIEANVSIKLDSFNQKFYLNSLILNHNLFDKNNVKKIKENCVQSVHIRRKLTQA